jgi:hypothetical protein
MSFKAAPPACAGRRGIWSSVSILANVSSLRLGSDMEKYDFRFQVWTGTLLIIVASFMAIGVSVPTVESGKVTEAGSPLWISFLVEALTLPGLFFCMYAYWRVRKRTTDLGLFFLCWAAYFGLALLVMRQHPDLDNPSTPSQILAISVFALVGVALFVFNRILVRRFASEFAAAASTRNVVYLDTGPPRFAIRLGRILLFIFCLFLTRVFVSPHFIQQDWPRVAVFLVVLLLSCVVSGLITEEAVPKFLNFLHIRQK